MDEKPKFDPRKDQNSENKGPTEPKRNRVTISLDLAPSESEESVKNSDNRPPQVGDNEDPMVQALLCSICCEIMHDSIALQPCGHSFCAGCFSDWMVRSIRCPECRLRVKRVAKNRRMNNLIEIFLKMHPEKSRPEDDLKELDKKNRITSDIFVPAIPEPTADIVSSESEESESSDSDDDNSVYEQSRPSTSRAAETKSSNVDNVVNYSPLQIPVCVQCVNFGRTAYNATSVLIRPPKRDPPLFVCAAGQSHLICQCCGTFMPDRRNDPACDISFECTVCKKSFCHLYFGCSRYGCKGCLNKFEEMIFDDAIFNNIVNENFFESEILKKHLNARNLTWTDLFSECLTKLDENTFDCRDKATFSLTSKSVLCIHCALQNFRDLAYEYRKQIKVESSVMCRPNCWYGRNCRTQKSKPSHAAKLNHICEQTRF